MIYTDGMGVWYLLGAVASDNIYEITNPAIVWNVTRLQAAADRGDFGLPIKIAASVMPPPNWAAGSLKRAVVDRLKVDPAELEKPAIIVDVDYPDHILRVVVAGNNRVAAKQELGHKILSFYVVPPEIEKTFRVEIVHRGPEKLN